MKNNILIILIAASFGGATAFAAPGGWSVDDQFSLSTGLDYSSGKYGAASATEMLPIPVSGEYEGGQWMLSVAIPFSIMSRAASSASGSGYIGPGGTTINTTPGLGDTVAAASYNIYSGRASTFGIDLTGKIKLNATDVGLGVGQNDYSAQADAYQNFNKFSALGSLGYKVLGSSTGINVNKVIYGSFGGHYQLDEKIYGGIDLSLSQNPSRMGLGQRELTAYVSHKINKNFKAKGYVFKGFSNGSPDSSLGAQVYYGF